MQNLMMVAVFGTARHARAAMTHLKKSDVPAHCIHSLHRNPVTRWSKRRTSLTRVQRRRAMSRGAVVTVNLMHVTLDMARKILAAHKPHDVRIIQQEFGALTDQQYEPGDFNDVIEMTGFFSR